MLTSRTAKPPVEIVAKAVVTLSNHGRPKSRRSTISTPVSTP